jgi:3-hydroxybutyryl-CoA dehydrogenase
VIGSGTMGAGIAEVAASRGHPVLIYDIAGEAISARSTVFASVWPPA